MHQHWDKTSIVFISKEGVFGTVEDIGAFDSVVSYSKGGEDYDVLIGNEDFIVVDEIVFDHIEESH